MFVKSFSYSLKYMKALKTSEVFPSLQKHILADGFDVVMDLDASKGARLVDAKNNRTLVDFFSFFASNPVGFNHPMLSEPAFEERLLHASKVKVSNSDVYTTYFAEFVESFSESFCPMFDKLFFISGGALGVENCIKAAQDWKVQKNLQANKTTEQEEKGTQVLHFKEAFHGRTGYTMSVTNTVRDKTKYFAKFDWPRVLNPKICFPLNEESQAAVAKTEEQSIQQIKQAFQDRPDHICAILVETIQGEGGDNFFRPEFHQKLKELALENEALLIYDEVQTGFGFTGKRWAWEHYDVKPDLMAFGKKVQTCGSAANLERLNEVENVFQVSSRINSTWGGNLVDMVRATQFIEIINKENLIQHADQMGKYMLEKLSNIASENKLVTNVRGLGLWMAFDMPDAEKRDAAIKACWKNGLMILPCGTHSIRLRPVLNLQKDEADEGLSLLEKSLHL